MGSHKKHAYLQKKVFIKLESHKIMLIELQKYLKHRIIIYNICISFQTQMLNFWEVLTSLTSL